MNPSNPGAILSLISDLYVQVGAQAAEIERLARENEALKQQGAAE